MKPIYYVDSSHIEWNISSFYFLKFWWLWLQWKFSVSENKNVTRSIKKGYFKQKCQDSEKYSFLCTRYLVGPPFAWITAAMRRGMESISLWHCSGVMEAHVALIAVRSSALLGLVSLIFYNTPWILYGVQVRQVCWPIKHSNTMVIEPAFGTFGTLAVGAGAKSCWKMKSASP